MKDYSKTINNVTKIIVDSELKSLNKTPSENVSKKRNMSLQIAINKEIEFIQSILTNAKVVEKDKDRFIKKILKMYATEAKNGNKISAKIIKKIRQEMINQIENYEIALLNKKQKNEKEKQAKKVNFEVAIDKMMLEKNKNKIEEIKKRTIKSATTISKEKKVHIASKLKNQKLSKKIKANMAKRKKEEKKEITALVIQDDRFVNRIKRTINDFSRKVQNLFRKKQQEKSFMFVEESGRTSMLSQKSTSTNAFIKRVCVDMKKVSKLAAMNAGDMKQVSKR